MLTLTWPQAAAWRIQRHHLVDRAPARRMLDLAGRLCGLHAQLMSSAELTLWARLDNLDRGAVPHALWQDRTLVKMWAMRGTLHVLPTHELSLWHAALSTSPRFLKPAAWKRIYGITIAQLDRITDAVATALDGRIITREELAREVARLTRSPHLVAHLAGNSWGTILRPAAFSGRLCFAPNLGSRVRFTRPDTWLASSKYPLGPPVDPRIATTEIARRFLAAYGPATHRDLARWWNGGGMATAREWIASLRDEVIEVDLAGDRAFMLAAEARKLRDLPPTKSVRLLPAFDQYVVAASCHAANLLPRDLRARVFRPQGWISPVLLVNGLMQGIWRHEIKGSRVAVTIDPFVKIPTWVRRAAAEEAERLAAFLGGSLTLTYAPLPASTRA